VTLILWIVKDDSDSELSQLDEVEFLRSFLAYKGQLQSNGRVAPIATMTANGASQPEVYSAEILEDDYDFEIFANASEEIFWDDDFEVFSDASEEILEDGQNPKSVHTQETDFEGEYTSDAAIENRSGADKAINTGDISDNVTSDNAEDTPANLQAGDPVDDFDIFMADVGPLSDNVTSKATGFVEDTPGRDIQAAGAILASAIEEHTFEAYDTFLNVETTEDQDSAQDFFIEQHKSEVHDASLTVGINSQTNSATPTNNQNSYIEDTVQDGDFKTHDTTFKSTIESQLSGHNDQRSFSDNVGAASEAINSIIEENAILNSVVEQHIATTNTSVGHNNPANGPETTKGDNNVSSDAVAIPTDEKSSAAKVPVPSFGHIPKSTRPDIASNPTLCHKPYKQEEVTKMMELYQERASRSHIRKKNLAVIDWRNLVDTYNVIFPQRMRSKNALQCRVKKELKKARKMKERTPPAPTSAPIDGDVGPTEEASTEAGIAGPFADGLERGDGPLEEPKIKWVYPKLDDNRYLEGTKYDKSGKPEGWINDPNDNEDSTDRATISIETLQKLNVFKLPTSSLFFSEEEIVYFTELANLLMETYCVPLQQLDLELLFNSFRYFRKHHHITPSPERTNGEIYKLYLRQINHGVRNNSLTLRRQAEYERRMNLKPGTIHADTPRLYTPIEVAERANAVAWVLLKMDPNIDLNNRRDLAEMFGQGEHPISILEMGIVGTYPGLKPFSKSATEWREIAAAKRLKLPKRNRYSTKDEPIQLVSDSEDDFDDEVIPEGHVVS
jgi:hypothetical protein